MKRNHFADQPERPLNAAEPNGKQYWRSLDQLSETEEAKQFATREFQDGAAELTTELANPLTRRSFLSIMGASMALAGLTGCRRPVEKIIPYVNQPENITLGVAQQYATTITFGTSAYGLIVESHEGRPTKIEGNPLHPSSLGAASTFVQASLLNLYDPDRSRNVERRGSAQSSSEFTKFWQSLRSEFIQNGGEGLAVIVEPFSAPTESRLMNEFKAAYPKATIVAYESISDENIYEGMRLASGAAKATQPVYRFDKAKVILSLDHDFVQMDSESIKHARGFIDGRRVTSEAGEMNRLYVVESTYTLTGGMADHRLRMQSGQIAKFAMAVATELGLSGAAVPSGLSEKEIKWVKAIAKDLTSQRGAGLVVAGRRQPAEVHALTALINNFLGNTGTTMFNGLLDEAMISNRTALAELTTAMAGGRIKALFMLGGNPVYNAPSDLNFAEALKKVQHTVHLSTHRDETSRVAEWHLPVSTFLEHWGDAKSVDGTLSVVQPLIEPMFNDGASVNQHSVIEMLHLLTTGLESRGYELVRKTWQRILTSDFETKWRKLLHDGVFKDDFGLPANTVAFTTESPDSLRPAASGSGGDVTFGNPITGGGRGAKPRGRSGTDKKITEQSVAATETAKPAFSGSVASLAQSKVFSAAAADAKNLEVVFIASPNMNGGEFANNAWMQELPDSITKLTWDNAALISMRTASELGVKNEDVISIKVQGRELEMPVWVLPGHADFSITLALGYGRKDLGRVAKEAGFNVYPLRTLSAMGFTGGTTATKTGRTYKLATTQEHGSMEGRPLVREASFEEYKAHPDFVDELTTEHPPLKSLWDEPQYTAGNQWGMSIDLNACTGCNACAVACQSENNIAVIGKEQVGRGREMHWLRMDRYFEGDTEGKKPEELKLEEMMKFEDLVEMVHQPMACQHCENAPCEQVCPVAATVHDQEGLNTMIYNRCIGTKYCANNCPYKVRRFNFFNYTNDNDVWGGDIPEIVKMAQNPDVTVRSRGVMEKCTYCVQRIREGEQGAKLAGRDLRDGDVVSACQQTCPTGAIVFGNILDPNSKVSQLKKQNRTYAVLEELNVKPRTTYLAKLRNPNPELEPSASAGKNEAAH
ncbi:MAG: TAT-variant-translocated molybdopterin oxidoreductase [Rhizobacter sp.]|nr:TAT-variant-translocated molybdopterin oxidoreductase [Chlorobiales bacterium]